MNQLLAQLERFSDLPLYEIAVREVVATYNNEGSDAAQAQVDAIADAFADMAYLRATA